MRRDDDDEKLPWQAIAAMAFYAFVVFAMVYALTKV
jgi:hypothetical protein